jgi:hypothetical protein
VVVVAGVAGMIFMGLAVVGSVHPWPVPPYDTLPPIFAIYMAVGIIWLIYDRPRRRR